MAHVATESFQVLKSASSSSLDSEPNSSCYYRDENGEEPEEKSSDMPKVESRSRGGPKA